MRLPPELVQDPARLGLGPALIAGHRVLPLNLQLPAGDALEHGDRLVHRRLLAAADVVEGARPSTLHRKHRRPDDVTDVREASTLLAVAVERERVPLDERGDDTWERHVRALARPVGVEVPQD